MKIGVEGFNGESGTEYSIRIFIGWFVLTFRSADSVSLDVRFKRLSRQT